MDLGLWETLGRIALAGVLGALIGIDRDLLHKPAGARTLMMVSFGAALFTIAGIHIATTSGGELDSNALSRVAQGVIGGIGFLGAGVIINNRGHVRGVTTAAGIWVTAGVGVACGLGQYLLAAIAAGLVVLTFTSSRFMYRDVEPDKPGNEPSMDGGPEHGGQPDEGEPDQATDSSSGESPLESGETSRGSSSSRS